MKKHDLIEQVHNVVTDAFNSIGNDLRGGSILDLCADQLTMVDLDDLQWAILASSTIRRRSSVRVWQQTREYEV